jgi:mannose-6-phosphate isomerase-like protein (cupin superfamily)
MMKIVDIDELADPLVTQTGEIIYELIGAAGDESEIPNHSLARIVLPPGKSSSLHYHKISQETYYILQGVGLLKVGDETERVSAGQACYIPAGQVHQISNQTEHDLVFLAVCTPAWIPEDSFEV